MFVAGFITGNLLLEPLADKLGRKYISYISSIIVIIINFEITFEGSAASLFLCLYFQGAMISVFLGNTLVYILEISNIKQRSMFASYVLLGIPISGIVNELLLHAVGSWKYTFMLSTISILLWFSVISKIE